ncbi:MAG: methyl-accepting chemotaxis protein [Hydrococcus sp. Prado102]|jgi:methyl-accepting chemotaxis protein|nr:methyl-accepting chemotaxis protein [Hydrococcus sp. Prado102]
MFNNLKLRGRILSGYSIPIAMSLLVTGIVLVNVDAVKNKFVLTEISHDVLDEIKDMAFEITNMQKSARGYLIAKNDTSLAQYKQEKDEFLELAEDLKQKVENEQQLAALNNIISIGQEVATYNQNLIDLVNRGKQADATAIWAKGEGRDLAEELEEIVEAFEKREKEILEERIQKEQTALNNLNIIVILGSLFSTAASIALGLWIASAISRIIAQTTNKIASSANEIATTVEQQERTVTQQATSVNQTSSTMDELGASSRQSTEQAESSASSARQVLDVAETGTKTVQQTMEGMSTLKEQVRAIAEQILRLSEKTGQIANISELVGDIANQTNMLALNAAVEAARAGEQGKGFSVVASEIRKLADESKKSAEKINALVIDLQASMNSTVMVTDEGTKKTDVSIKLAQETAKTFITVTDAVNGVFINNQQISLSAKQQAIAVQQVLEAMNSINLGAKETVAGFSQVKVSTQQLNEAAKQLQALV